MAVASCMVTWIFILVLMISLYGVFGLGGSRLLLPCFVYLPMVCFFTVFFFGQQLSFGLWSPSVWIDRLCIHQTDLELKAEQINSVPTFVVRSSRLLILCDGSYFERLLGSAVLGFSLCLHFGKALARIQGCGAI